MKKSALLIALAAFVLGGAFFTGCKSTAEKACDNMAELAEGEGEEASDDDMEKCVKSMEELEEKCPEVVECFADAGSEDDIEECMGDMIKCAMEEG